MFNLSRPHGAQLNMPLTLSTRHESRRSNRENLAGAKLHLNADWARSTTGITNGICHVVTYRLASSGFGQSDPIVFDGFGHKLHINLYASLLLGQSPLTAGRSLVACVRCNSDSRQISRNATAVDSNQLLVLDRRIHVT